MEDNRIIRRTLKKKKRRKWVLFSLLFILLSFVSYTTYEYFAGKNAAMEQVDDKSNEMNEKYKEDFKGVDDGLKKTNVLLLGSDSRGEEDPRTDTIMIGQYDPEKETAKLVSIMRDSYVNIPGYGYNKINAAFHFGGPELLRQTIKENFGIDLEYYAIVDFEGFTEIVDTIAPDGVEINVEKHMSRHIGVTLEPGRQTLNGKELLGYARYRYSDSDFERVERQQKVMKKLKEKLVSFSGVLKLPRMVGTLQPYINTNMETSNIISLGKDFLLNPVDDIETLRIPVRDKAWDAHHEHAGSVLEFNETEMRQIIQEFLNEE
ncbi:cell envelope-related function transcriptional attenuator common domain-containing protein [Salinibacillus kushneri]|uniref:Regulatory protein MsrR n=1 Tax=Salinibacillus kushneri TaxID=237682 RepID=A0A1I0J2J6_9BACI|nr:LCP family protein [Salinibacillus kushneri]SEU03253.1 cell envelope-related function transcriptional attenuator common domain-containing protein [Salinibacillus kushneri]